MKESGIVTAIQTYLQILENQGKLVVQRNNSGAVMTNRLGRNNFIRFGKAGSPDFYVFLPNGKTIMLEVKNEKGKLSESQQEFKDRVERLGFRYEVARSVDEVEQLTKGDF